MSSKAKQFGVWGAITLVIYLLVVLKGCWWVQGTYGTWKLNHFCNLGSYSRVFLNILQWSNMSSCRKFWPIKRFKGQYLHFLSQALTMPIINKMKLSLLQNYKQYFKKTAYIWRYLFEHVFFKFSGKYETSSSTGGLIL